MRRIVTIFFILFSFAASAQSTTQFIGSPTTKLENKGVFQSDSGFVPPQDTIMRATWDKTKRHWSALGDSIYVWSPVLQKFILYKTGSGTGTVTSVGISLPASFSVSGSPITSSGTISISGTGTTSQYLRGDLSLSNFQTDAVNATSSYYSPIGHTHTASDILLLTQYIRNSLSAGTGLAYNATTGQFSFPGSAAGITSLNGLTDPTQTFSIDTAGTKFEIVSIGTGHTFKIPSRISNLDISGKLNISDTAAMLAPYKPSGSTNTNIGSGYRWAIPNTNNIKTFFAGYGTLLDSSSNTNGLTIKVDTTVIASKDVAQKGYTNVYTLADSTAFILVRGNGTRDTVYTQSGFNSSASDNTTIQTLTYGSTTTWNAATSVEATVTLTGNTTLSITNLPTDGKAHYLTIRIVQDATGGRTVTWPSSVKWPGGTAPTLTTTGSKEDLITFRWNGTNLYGAYKLNY